MSTIYQSSLPTPNELALLAPLSESGKQSIAGFRSTCADILRSTDQRLVLILGPCSIHDCDAAMEYGQKIKALQQRIAPDVFLVMRVFLEKPRTRIGWKGLLYDPFLDGSNHLAEGLKQARKLLVDLAQLGVPSATEFLDPIVSTYLADLISWGVIGARTTASQPHRQLASGLGFPVGFKNEMSGQLDQAINGIIASRLSHTHFSIDGRGKIAALQTTGNPLAHLVLRGDEKKINCDPESVQKTLQLLKEHHLEERIVIDCAHGNSGKEAKRQIAAFNLCKEQIQRGCSQIRGLMLESNLYAGKQPIPDNLGELLYGISVTDDCLSWEETEDLVSSICMSGAQN